LLDLLRQPHYRFFGNCKHPNRPTADIIRLAGLEVSVPGALVYGFAPGSGKRIRLKKIVDNKIPTPPVLERFEIIVVVHGAFLVDGLLTDWKYAVEVEAHKGADSVFAYPEDDSALQEEGAVVIQRLADNGVLVGNIVSQPRPWQKVGPAWALSRPWVLKIWPTGTGKTAGAFCDIAAIIDRDGGDAIIVVPGGARPTWQIQAPQYLAWRTYMMKPESQQRKKDEDFEAYVADCRESDRPAVVVVGLENLVDHLPAIREHLRPTVLIIDEIHKLGSHARWTAVFQTDGSITYEPKTTETGNKVTQSVAAMQAASLPTIRFREGMTATPLGDGKPRRIWSPLDLLSRGGFGYSYWNTHVMRYCGGRPAEWGGGIDDSGQTNSPELRARLSFIRHQVPYSATRVGMQPFKVEIVRLPPELQTRPERFSDGETFNQAIRRAGAEALTAGTDERGLLVRGRSVEYQLMDACSRKRAWVIDKAVEALQGGGKVVVFTGRRVEVDVWSQRIERVATRGDDKMNLRTLKYSGAYNDKDKIEIERAFREDDGPLLLVATGHSIGESFDGLQHANVAILAMLPWQADQFIQWRGRFDRINGVPTTLFVVVALKTYDERVVNILVEKFGNIEEMFAAEEIAGLGDRMTGSDNRQTSLAAMLSLLGTGA